MARYLIPDNAGPYHVNTAKAGNYIVLNHSTGKRKVLIPCRDREHAKEVCRQLNENDHQGHIDA